MFEGTADNNYTNIGWLPGIGRDCHVVGVHDLGGDGQPVTVFDDIRSSAGVAHVFKEGSLVYDAPEFLATSLGDTDGNGSLEIIGKNFPGKDALIILEDSGDNTFKEVLNLPGWWQAPVDSGMRAHDLDEDGQTEVLRRLAGDLAEREGNSPLL